MDDEVGGLDVFGSWASEAYVGAVDAWCGYDDYSMAA